MRRAGIERLFPIETVHGPELARMAEEVAGLGFWRMEVASGRIQWSPNMFRAFGFDPNAEPRLAEAMSRVHPDDRALADLNLEKAIAGETPPTQTRIIQPSGEIRYVEGRTAVERDASGAVVALFGTMMDVTHRRLAEIKLAESERQYRLLATNVTDIIACFTPDAVITFMSPSIVALLGYSPDEVIGRRTYDLIHPDDHDRVREEFRAFLALGPDARPVRIEYRALTKAGDEIWLEAQPRGIFDPQSGALVEIQDSVRDVSVRKALEAELRSAKDAAERATAVKTEFLANISHEVRTPLTAIIGYADLLNDNQEIGEDARRSVGLVLSASRVLHATVNGILDFSRLEAGRVTIRPVPCSPEKLAMECVDLLTVSAEAKGLTVELARLTPLPAAVLLDPDAFRQVLLNLAGNAVKFTDEGYIVVGLGYDTDTQGLFATVIDTGPGIEAESIGKLFVRFSQVDGAATSGRGGTGLGLAICKGLVEAMGGGIAAASDGCSGSAFSFSIPAPITDAAAASGGSVAIEDVRVLVADDNPAAREIARKVLQASGAIVVEAKDGREATDIAAIQPFDVILLDLRMPRMDGLEAVRSLRNRRGPNRNAPIVAFTADSAGNDLHQFEASGFDAVLRKPIIASDLLTLVHRFSGRSGGDAQA